jgi:hypothetical protein
LRGTQIALGFSEAQGILVSPAAEEPKPTKALQANDAILDLPDTYSLSTNSEEELIAREYILREHPDLVVELLLLPMSVMLACNMMDVAEKEGTMVESAALEKAVGALGAWGHEGKHRPGSRPQGGRGRRNVLQAA